MAEFGKKEGDLIGQNSGMGSDKQEGNQIEQDGDAKDNGRDVHPFVCRLVSHSPRWVRDLAGFGRQSGGSTKRWSRRSEEHHDKPGSRI